MIGVKEAVQNTKSFILDVVGKEEISRLTLEEVEMAASGEWLVTLGISYSDPFDLISTHRPNKVYKMFRVDRETGEVLAMLTPQQ